MDLEDIHPKVSILIPVYNREKLIKDTITSALKQTYRNIEVVIFDNASTDSTWEIIMDLSEKDERIKAFRNKTNLGPVRNWIKCVNAATGEFGKILWSDDLILPDFLEKSLNLLKKDVGFVYTATRIFDNEEPKKETIFYRQGSTGYYLSEEYIQKALFLNHVPVSPGCALFRLNDIKRFLWLHIPNKINSDFSKHAIGNDLLLFLLTAKEYKYYGYVNEVLSSFRSHKDSITVSSKGGRIQLHYALAAAYFVENFRPKYKNCFASYVQLLIWRYPRSFSFGLNNLEKFFEKPVNLDYYCITKIILNKTISKALNFFYTIKHYRKSY